MIVKRFEDLIRPFTLVKGVNTEEDFSAVAKHQREAGAQFPQLVAESYLHLWRPGDPVTDQGTRFLLGVATWSLCDTRLLDALNEAFANGRIVNDRIDVFDFASECKAQEDLEQFIPAMDIMTVFHTPVVGWWENGVLKEKASGAQGRNILIAYYGMSIDLSSKPTTP